MPKFADKYWFYCLRALVYCKRALVWTIQSLSKGWAVILKIFRSSVGFKFYKIKVNITGKTNKSGGLGSRFWGLFGSRAMLQALLFLAIAFTAFPQSRWFKADPTKMPGRETLLYQLIGPGNEDFSLEEVGAEAPIPIAPQAESWKQGAVIAQPTTQHAQYPTEPQQLAGLSAGGTALSKPIIMPGATAPTGQTASERTELVIHTVKQGETVGAIAEQYGISVATILWSNNLTARSLIRPGDQLKILPTSGLVHKIKRGDTIGKIAKLYNTDAQKIVKYNKLQEDGSDIVIGEELIIPGGSMPTPVYVAPVRRYTQLSNIAAPPPSIAAPAGSGYVWPAGARHITQYFGWRHSGVDVGGAIGTALYAAKSGTVIRSQCGWNGGYGCYIIIDHGNGVTTLYGHASQLYVSVGEDVAQGQTIALMGSTGRSTGPHLHFEVRVNGIRQNPLRYIR